MNLCLIIFNKFNLDFDTAFIINDFTLGETVVTLTEADFTWTETEITLPETAGKEKRYIISSLLDIISPPGAASLKVKLIRDIDFIAIAGAQVKIQRDGFPAITKETDANGEAEMPNIDAGIYTVTVTIGGEPVRTFTKEVNVGTNARMELVIPKV